MRSRRLIRTGVMCAASIAALAACAAPALTASSTTVVSARVPSATTVDSHTGCRAGSGGTTDFGTVLPGTPLVTTTDCTVTFGASNDGSSLRVRQPDGVGRAMWSYGTGARDLSYGGTGHVAFDVGGGDFSMAVSSVAMPDGDSLVGSRCGWAAAADFCISRLDPNGSPDVGFNGGTHLRVDFAGGEDNLKRVFVAPDGAMMAVGACQNPVQRDVCVIRLRANGTLDPGFDGDGRLLIDVDGEDDYGKELLDAAHGRIFVTGDCALLGPDDFCAFLIDAATGTRLAPFGSNGIRIPIGTGTDWAAGAVLLPDGDVMLYGECDGTTAMDFCLARMNPNGTLDGSFGTGGKLLVDVGTVDNHNSSATLTPDGGVTLLGTCGPGGSYVPCGVRLRPNMTLDPNFSGDGMATWPAQSVDDSAGEVLALADGAVLQVGECNDVTCLRRVLPNGTLDATWGTGGVRTWSSTGDDWGRAGHELGDGVIQIVGGCTDESCAWRLPGGATIDDYVTGGGSDRDWSSGTGTSLFGTCLHGVGGTASASWSIGACDMTDGAQWRALPTAASTVATATAGTASVSFRFGFRPATTTTAARYVAPVTFEVVGASA